MVYDVLLHVVSVEDMRRRGPTGRQLFFPFRFNLGVPVADQEVAPIPAPEGPADAADREEDGRPPARPRHSCSAEYWRPNQRDRSDEDDDEDPDGRGGKSIAPHRCSLFQRLRWPREMSRPKERSPRLERGESSRQGGPRLFSEPRHAQVTGAVAGPPASQVQPPRARARCQAWCWALCPEKLQANTAAAEGQPGLRLRWHLGDRLPKLGFAGG